MPFTNFGVQASVWNMGSSISNNYIQYYGIGIGSATSLITDVILSNETGLKTAITGSPDFTFARKVTFIGNFNSVQMSGVQLAEYGLFASGTAGVGSIWFRESFSHLTFDGTNELELSATIEGLAG